MKLDPHQLDQVAQQLRQERQRQKLSREALAAVCGVSVSFVRDAELNPDSCSLGKLVRLINGLGLGLALLQRNPPQPGAASPRALDYGVPPAATQAP